MASANAYDCPNHHKGCPFVGPLEDLDDHLKKCKKTNWEVNGAEKEEKVSPSTAQEVYNSIVRPEVQHLRIVEEYHNEKKADFTWVVNDIKRLFKGSQNRLASDVFPLRGYPFGAQAFLQFDQDKILVSLSYTGSKKSKENVDMRPTACVTWTFRDQSDNAERKDVILKTYFPYNVQLQYNTGYSFTLQNMSKIIIKSSTYSVNGKVVIDIHVEAPEVARLVYSHDGTITWAIDEYRKRKWTQAEGLRASYVNPYFYTGPNGYRVRVSTFLNGYEAYKNKGLTMYIGFLSGLYHHFDEAFPHKTTVTLFHPTRPNQNISKSVEKDIKNEKWYAIDVGTHQEVEKLLFNDTLYFNVVVQKTS